MTTTVAPFDLEPHNPPCATHEEHVDRCYAEAFAPHFLSIQPGLGATLVDFAQAVGRAWDEECSFACPVDLPIEDDL